MVLDKYIYNLNSSNVNITIQTCVNDTTAINIIPINCLQLTKTHLLILINVPFK